MWHYVNLATFYAAFPLDSSSIYSCFIQIFRRFLTALLQSPCGLVIRHNKQWVSTGFINDFHDFLNFSCIPLSHHISKLQGLGDER